MNLPAASMTLSSAVSGRIAAPAGPTWVILLPSMAITEFGAASLPDPSMRVPFLIRSRGCQAFTLASSCTFEEFASL